jgi:two-component sensor histidine kinase
VIKISLINTGENFVLTVFNDGYPPPEDFNIENPKGLGMQLVNSLTLQLHGELSYEYDEGTKFTLKFIETPISTYSEV